MSSTSMRSTSRRIVTLMAALGMIFALAPVGAASAHTHLPLAAVVVGNANLSGGIGACNASGTFTGTAVVGVHGAMNPDTHPIVMGSASASFTYCNTTTVEGTASGDLTIEGHTCGFDWERTGLTAIILFRDGCSGGGAAGFAPDPNDPNGAIIGGVGVAV